MKTTQKLILCLGLLTLLSAPLAGCSSTWGGMKQDWHNMTGSDDETSSAPATAATATTTTTTTATTTAPASAAPQAAPASGDTVIRTEYTTTNKRKSMKTLHALLLGLSLVAMLGLSACHTVQGLGEDTAEAGHAIEHAASH